MAEGPGPNGNLWSLFRSRSICDTPVNAVHTRQNDPTQTVERDRVLVEICVLREHVSPNQILKIDLDPAESHYAAWPYVTGLERL